MNEQGTLQALASKYVWWQAPEVTLARQWHFLCQMMSLGTAEDMRTVRRLLGDEAIIDALEHAPPGIMDPKSWNFWHLFFGRPVPPLPVRPLP